MYGLVKKHGGTVVLDAVQAAARMVPGEWTGHADMLVFSGHKMYGPKGIAAVWINPAAESFLRNWRRQGFARGTADISAIAGLAKAAELCTSRQKAELPRMRVLMREGLEILEKKCEFTVNSPENSAPGICNISFPRVNNMAKLLFELDARNIQLSRFSACTSGLEHPSRILLAMGKTRGIAEKSVRICLGRNSSRNDFFRLANELSALQKSDI